MTSSRGIFIIGSGPLIGSHVASLFGSKGFNNIALFSRSQSNLDREAASVASAAPKATIKTYPADVSDTTLTSALEKAIAELGTPEVVVFNAARIRMGKVGEYSAEDIVEDYKISNLGLYTTACVLMPKLKDLAQKGGAAHPALYVTSGLIIHKPYAPAFSLTMAKTAQWSLAKVLADENEDVHVALVTVGGHVSEEEEVTNPTNIATKYWELYQQKKADWEFEIRCGW